VKQILITNLIYNNSVGGIYMSEEKMFTVVGTAINPKGELKMRWANDLVQRINILIKGKCEDINLHETPEPMTKLQAAEWLLNNTELTPNQEEVVALKVDEKAKKDKRTKATETITDNVKNNVKENKPTDPRIAKFIEDSVQNAENKSENVAEV